MLMVIIELRNNDTVKDAVTDGDYNSVIGSILYVGEQAFYVMNFRKSKWCSLFAD
jgi:hypothetical protein